MSCRPTISVRSRLSLAGGACVLVLAASSRPARAMDLLVPAYFDPTDSAADWARMNTAATRVSLTAIMNPASGPGTGASSAYTSAIGSLHASGGRVLGYVSTSYAVRPLAAVEADVDRYLSWYPAIDGIFFDEMTSDPDSAHVGYYASLHAYVKSKGATLRTITNPGTTTAESYFTTPCADTICTFESNTGYGTAIPPSWTASYPAPRFYNLPYNVSSSATMLADLSLARSRNVGNAYVTDDAGANPWDTLPSYWDAEVNGVLALTPTWNVNASGDWNAASRWSTNAVPNAVGATAKLFGVTTSPTTVFTNGAVTLGTLSFNSGQTYVVGGAGSLTMDVSASNDVAMIEVLRGAHTINLPLKLLDSTNAFVAAGAKLTIADPLTLASGASLDKSGPGQLSIISTVETAGATGRAAASVRVSSGTLESGADLGSRASVAVRGGGTLTLRARQHLASLEVEAAGSVAVVANLFATGALSLAPGGRIDLLGNGDGDVSMIVNHAATAQFDFIARIAQARHDGRWDGDGITSSAAARDPLGATALGLLNGAQFLALHGNGTHFAGEAVNADDVLILHTWYGDTDLDGSVTAADYQRTDRGFAGSLCGWVNGDFDLNQRVDLVDYARIDLAYNAQRGTLSRAISWLDGNSSSMGMDDPALRQILSHFDAFGQPYAASFLAAVPEPASLAGCAAAAHFGVVAARGRRRRAAAASRRRSQR